MDFINILQFIRHIVLHQSLKIFNYIFKVGYFSALLLWFSSCTFILYFNTLRFLLSKSLFLFFALYKNNVTFRAIYLFMFIWDAFFFFCLLLDSFALLSCQPESHYQGISSTSTEVQTFFTEYKLSLLIHCSLDCDNFIQIFFHLGQLACWNYYIKILVVYISDFKMYYDLDYQYVGPWIH